MKRKTQETSFNNLDKYSCVNEAVINSPNEIPYLENNTFSGIVLETTV